MASVKIQEVIEHLDYEMKRALEDAFQRVAPDVRVDRNSLYREFRKAVGRKASTWVDVPDQDVKKRCRLCNKES
jgi:hypothetical protein